MKRPTKRQNENRPSRRSTSEQPKRRRKANRPLRSKTTFARPVFRTLRGWAIGTLLETHAIIECSEHGHIRDRGTWPHGWDEACDVAKVRPFAGATVRKCIAEINEVMSTIGDTCPECRA